MFFFLHSCFENVLFERDNLLFISNFIACRCLTISIELDQNKYTQTDWISEPAWTGFPKKGASFVFFLKWKNKKSRSSVCKRTKKKHENNGFRTFRKRASFLGNPVHVCMEKEKERENGHLDGFQVLPRTGKLLPQRSS